MKQFLPQAINVLLFVITLLLSLQVTFEPPVWLTYSDAYDYLHQSRMSLLDPEFYFPHKAQGFYPRPFTVPLFYKLAGSNEETIVRMQQLVHALSALLVGFALLRLLTTLPARLTFLFLWYLLMGWWNILGWTHLLLSESLSISLLFCWLATFFLYWKERSVPWLLAHIIVTILFSFTRDSWPYFLIVFYICLAILVLTIEKELKKGVLAMITVACLIFFMQQRSAEAGDRYRLPVMNNIVLRILPEENHLTWFSERGMPLEAELKSKYGNLDDPKKIYALYTDTAFRAFSDWAASEGKSLYTQFLLTHPGQFFLCGESSIELERMMAYNVGYTGPVSGYSSNIEPLFPLFHPVGVLLLNALLLFVYWKKKNSSLLLPSMLIVVFTINAVLLYLADAMEVERHLLITNVITQFIGILLIAILLDHVDSPRGFFRRKQN